MKQQVSSTMPIVESDGLGGHEPYFRIDSQPVAGFGGTAMLPTPAISGQPALTADREVLAAIAALTEAFREFTLVFIQTTGP